MGKQSGFTLIEIAIVLVIIGLLLGGILKGQELINQAKVKNIANDLNGVSAAVYTYQDRYKALPGDDKAAATRWTISGIDGDRDGTLKNASVDETKFFWRHLRLAGLIAGDAASQEPPFNALNGLTTVHDGAAGFTGAVVCTSGLPAKIAEPVDSQFDDGKPKTGSVRATKSATDTAITDQTEDAYVEAKEPYRICKQL